MIRFLECYNFVENLNTSISLYGPRDHLLPHRMFIFSVRIPVRGEILFLKLRPFLAPGHIMRRFGLFVPGPI